MTLYTNIVFPQPDASETLKKLITSILSFPLDGTSEDMLAWHNNVVHTIGHQYYAKILSAMKDVESALKFKEKITAIWPDICNKNNIRIICGEKEFDGNWLLILGMLMNEEI